MSPGGWRRRYYGRSNLARLSEGFGKAAQVDAAGYVVAAWCGPNLTGHRPDKITLHPDLLVPLRRAAWTRRGRIGDEQAGGGRDRPELREAALAPAGMSLVRRSRR